MAQIGNVKEIKEVKEILDSLLAENILSKWELPYENLLTRLSAAIFFIETVHDEESLIIQTRLSNYPNVRIEKNDELSISKLPYRVFLGT